MDRQAFVVAGCLALCLASPAAAQRPLASPPTSPQFLSRYDFHLSATALANADPRFSWDTHFGGAIDVVDFVHGRIATAMDYEAVLGNELRAFDPNQGNYMLEVSTSYRAKPVELAAIFHHVSRHLSDRPKVIPVAWNILGIRLLHEARFKGAILDTMVDFGGTTEKANVDYRWSTNVDLRVTRLVFPRAAVFVHGVGHLMNLAPPRGALTVTRHAQTGGFVEGGVRLVGEDAVGELFAGFEHRFDAYPLGGAPEKWFMVGFRVLRR